MPEQEVFQDLTFPIHGMDSSGEFGSQRAGTTALGENVRVQDPQERRMRGGSRSGLSKYVRQQVDWESEDNEPFENVIQHLNIIVDPTVDALLANFDSANGDEDGLNAGTITDPSTNNLRRRSSAHLTRKVRDGGSGRQQRRRTPKPVLTITANDRSKTYGDTLVLGTTQFTVTGLDVLDTLSGVTLKSRGAVATAKVPPPGETYRIMASAAVGTIFASTEPLTTKYRIKYVNGKLTVNKASRTITPNDQNKIQGQGFIFQGTEYAISSLLLNADAITSVRMQSAGAPASAAVGTYPITVTGLRGTGLQNYDIILNTGTMTVLTPVCPWLTSIQRTVQYTIDYSEATGPFNTVHAPTVINTNSWTYQGTLTQTKTSGNLGDPFVYGSVGQGSALLVIDKNGTDVRLTATLQSLGLAWDTLTPSVVQVVSLGCDFFNAGSTIGVSWVGTAFPLGPIGLVMVLDITIAML